MKYLCLAYEQEQNLTTLTQEQWLELRRETKEQIGGFFLIDVASEAEALEIAAGWPSARLGTIEVRPVEEALRPEGRY